MEIGDRGVAAQVIVDSLAEDALPRSVQNLKMRQPLQTGGVYLLFHRIEGGGEPVAPEVELERRPVPPSLLGVSSTWTLGFAGGASATATRSDSGNVSRTDAVSTTQYPFLDRRITRPRSRFLPTRT